MQEFSHFRVRHLWDGHMETWRIHASQVVVHRWGEQMKSSSTLQEAHGYKLAKSEVDKILQEN